MPSISATETYLTLFEEAVRKRAEYAGMEAAVAQAKEAGLGISPDGRVVSCAGHPLLVLLRLVKQFTADGDLRSLESCTPLINYLTEAMAEVGDA